MCSWKHFTYFTQIVGQRKTGVYIASYASSEHSSVFIRNRFIINKWYVICSLILKCACSLLQQVEKSNLNILAQYVLQTMRIHLTWVINLHSKLRFDTFVRRFPIVFQLSTNACKTLWTETRGHWFICSTVTTKRIQNKV